MPYITKQQVKEKREQLKKEFPDFKFSVRTHSWSSVHVTIIAAPINLLLDKNNSSETVNCYYIAKHYNQHPEIRDVLLAIYDILKSGNYIESEDGDYGSIPKFYIHLTVGSLAKPFKILKSKKTCKFEKINIEQLIGKDI